MSEHKLSFAGKTKFAQFELDLMAEAIKRYFDILGIDPLLTLGRHKETGGLMVVPHQNAHALTDEILDILHDTIKYIEKARD